MKRKFLLLSMSIILLLCAVCFSQKPLSSAPASAISSEDSIADQHDVIPVAYDDLPSNELKSDASSSRTPFDNRTQKLMPGCSVTPKTNNHNEIKDVTYTVSSFDFHENHSIFVWIYFPDNPIENWYSLKLSFTNLNGDSITWNFPPSDLYSLLDDPAAYKFGWKLLELPFNSGTKSREVISNSSFFRFNISYEILLNDISDLLGQAGNIEFGEELYLTNGKMSLYHMYTGRSLSNSANIAMNINYICYSLKQEFIDEINSLLLNDTYSLKQPKDVFNYLYVGNSNYLSTSSTNSKFNFSYSVTSNLISHDRYPGETFTFENAGEATITLNLMEDRKTRNLTQMEVQTTTLNIFTTNYSIFISNYSFGSFNEGIFEIKPKEKYVIYFTVRSDFNLNQALQFTSSNEKIFTIESVEYDTETNRYVLSLMGKQAGRADIEVVGVGASAKRPQIAEYKSSATIDVEVTARGYSDLWIFLLTFLVICIISSLIFAFFTIKNIKKNKRMQNSE